MAAKIIAANQTAEMFALELIREREEQLEALAMSIESGLASVCEGAPDNAPLTCWRLSQILVELLADQGHLITIRLHLGLGLDESAA